MRGSYDFAEGEKEKYLPYIRQCIERLEKEEVDNISLTDTSLNPYNVESIVQELGYEELDFDCNGWDWDFWITFRKDKTKNIIVSGNGITADLKIWLDCSEDRIP